jgi:soluble lytic murein transglycosylase-like protein
MLAILTATAPALAGETARPAPARLAAADGAVTASLSSGATREARPAALPHPLSAGDVDLYRRALALQAKGQWAEADRDLGRVSDDLLLGYAQAQRLLAPSTHPKLPELRAWLSVHADLPQAEAIHRLALATKGSKGAGGLRTPQRSGALRGGAIETEADGALWEEVAFALDDASARARQVKQRLRQLLRDNESSRAEAMLDSAEIQALGALDRDRLRLMVASDHFAGGRDAAALRLASEIADRSGDVLPAAHWISGLALWRMGKPDQARHPFEEAATHADGQDWLAAASAFWAARANLVSHRPEVVNHWLEVSATFPRTFYGLLARAELGYTNTYSWDTPPFTENDADQLMRMPAARRALALIQLGERDEAEQELRRLYPSASKALRQSMLALAQNAQMPSLAVRLGDMLRRDQGRTVDSSAFPLPDWRPQGGWQIDRALVFALVRHESGFDPEAKSGAGATGLMQLMPATARAVGGGAVSPDRLTQPEVNLDLGQRYIARLLSQEPIGSNMLMMTAAYNAGQGTLGRWMQGMRHGDDPLMFVESLPARETRAFVMRVMSSYWIYQSRLGQPAQALDALAGGGWPLYSSTGESGPVAQARPRNRS